MALLEGKAEFLRRFREASGGGAGNKLPLLTSHCPGWTCYAEKVVDPMVLPHISPLKPPQQIQGRLVKTVLLEAHNQRRLHRWWRSRSPLFAAESAWWSRSVLVGEGSSAEGCKPLTVGDVYHVSVQPCFDRKIEASRPTFEIEDGIREVDTVLTATELLELIFRASSSPAASSADAEASPQPFVPEDGIAALRGMPAISLESETLTDVLLQRLQAGRPEGRPLICAVEGNGDSGGFAEYVFREAAKELFGKEISGPARFESKQNEDIREVLLKDGPKVLLKFVAAYGFRNIQNVIRRVTKPGPEGLARAAECGHFVEIMACPSGCLNGGGQVPEPKVAALSTGIASNGYAAANGGAAPPGKSAAAQSRDERKRRLGEMHTLLHDAAGVAVVPPEEHPLVLPLYRRIAALAAPARTAPRGRAAGPEALALKSLVGGSATRRWLTAEWRSLKVDESGKEIIGASTLKW